MTDEEQPNARARMKYEAGLKRIFAVLAVCWVAACVAVAMHNHDAEVLAAAVLWPALGYAFFFKVLPWIIEG
jgi:hypothetical protein